MGLNCLRCELIRAKAKATALLALGRSPKEIVATLSEQYGENYYIGIEASGDRKGWAKAIWRASKLPPYTPHMIKELKR